MQWTVSDIGVPTIILSMLQQSNMSIENRSLPLRTPAEYYVYKQMAT
ncbi:MAG: hypothetical protein OXI24_02400 [Candidatus Poribacteria bacterium]|nr:hypothetical protein [Candidatus Poribacteria bacterium]